MIQFQIGSKFRNCTGIPRRSFLVAGSAGIAGLNLANVLAAESGTQQRRQKSLIVIHLDGGPPQMDLIDPKPDAPIDVRSPFSPIATNVPGLFLTELMPRCGQIADRLVLLRSLVGSDGKHHAFQCQSGYTENTLRGIGGRPALGCVVNHLLSSPKDDIPRFVDLMQGRPLVRDSARPGFLGPSYKPFRPDISNRWKRQLEEGMKGELARRGEGHKTHLSLIDQLSLNRIDDRLELLGKLDRFQRQLDATGSMAAMDHFSQQAYSVLTSGKFAAAMDLDQEPEQSRNLYTPKVGFGGSQFYTSEGPDSALKFLLARRLIEAGVRVVSLSLSDFDTHGDNNARMQNLGPLFDFAFAALIRDLGSRGMLDDVAVLAWGEFGRTPKVNSKGGRDHWPRLSMGILAGGGMDGMVLGSSDHQGGEVLSRPVHFADVVCTLYRHLGIDPRQMIFDQTNRPHMLMDRGEVIRELV